MASCECPRIPSPPDLRQPEAFRVAERRTSGRRLRETYLLSSRNGNAGLRIVSRACGQFDLQLPEARASNSSRPKRRARPHLCRGRHCSVRRPGSGLGFRVLTILPGIKPESTPQRLGHVGIFLRVRHGGKSDVRMHTFPRNRIPTERYLGPWPSGDSCGEPVMSPWRNVCRRRTGRL
jgi:hypothetical protein